MSSPHVVRIWISPATGERIDAVEEIEAVAEKGLVGDRYYLGRGYYSGDKIWDANVTLVEQEAFDAASESADRSFTTDCLRRNIVTQNVDLNSLLGEDFQIGTAVFRGWKYWPPCKYIDSQNPKRDVLKKFAKSAGIGAKVIRGGRFRVGDVIEVVTNS